MELPQQGGIIHASHVHVAGLMVVATPALSQGLTGAPIWFLLSAVALIPAIW
jgi:uncharacterized membrane protein YhdT